MTTLHTCHWPGCGKPVPPKMWGCKPHWFKLPLAIRSRIWATYVPGQERRKDPDDPYLAAAREARDWAKEQNRKEQMLRDGKRS